MIRRLTIRNFRSIGEAVADFSFTEGEVGDRHVVGERLSFIEEAGVRCVPITAIFGANAAGKSNVVRALVTIMQFMTGQNAPNGRFVHDRNRLLKCGEVVDLQLEYAIGGRVYAYAIRYDGKGLKQESLACNGIELYQVTNGCRVRFGNLVRMPASEYNPEMFARALQAECTDDQGRFIYTFASLIARRFRGLNDEFKVGLIAFSKSVVVMNTLPVFLPQVIDEIRQVTGQSSSEILREVVDVIRELDVDILAIDINEYEVDQEDTEIRKAREAGVTIQKRVVAVHSTHRDVDGKDEIFDFMNQESDGTIRLATMIGRCLLALKAHGVLCVDEFERSLHPILVRELLKLFLVREYNGTNAQLIFTTHLVQLLDDSILRLPEVAIVDKNRQRGTALKRLAEMTDEGDQIQSVSGFRMRYLKGYYSGVPKAFL